MRLRTDLLDAYIVLQTAILGISTLNHGRHHCAHCAAAKLPFTAHFWASVHLAVLVPFGAGRKVASRALGVQASVYNVNAKNWIAPSESVEDIEQGKDRAAAHALSYLRRAANSELPPLNRKQSR